MLMLFYLLSLMELFDLFCDNCLFDNFDFCEYWDCWDCLNGSSKYPLGFLINLVFSLWMFDCVRCTGVY